MAFLSSLLLPLNRLLMSEFTLYQLKAFCISSAETKIGYPDICLVYEYLMRCNI